MKIKVVDSNTGELISYKKAVGRCFAYYVSMLPLMIGYLWPLWDKRKQALHDKLCKTVVVRV